MNLVIGLILGLIIGLIVNAFSLLKRQAQRAFAGGRDPRPVHRLVAGAGVCAIVAFLLNQQPQIHGHVIAVIREAEKFEVLRTTLLSHERSASYLLLMAFVTGCSLLWMVARGLSSSSTIVRATGVIGLAALIGCAYYVDSRFETDIQLFLGAGTVTIDARTSNPGRTEIVDDGVDHNCIGGALTQQGIDDWKNEHRAVHQRPDPSAQRLNVIYVFIDALRPDHLGAYGYFRNTSPNLDRLAARSSLFENAFTPAPNTF